MNKIAYISLLAGICLVSLSSCKKTEEKGDIIVEKVIEKPQEGPEKMAGDTREGTVNWIGGATYSYTVVRNADSQLPIVNNHGTDYCDNSISLTVRRADGSVFFEKTFTKENFAPVLPNDFKEHGVLLGMTLEKAEGNYLIFTVSVGSPDENNEEFYYVKMSLSNLGATSASKG